MAYATGLTQVAILCRYLTTDGTFTDSSPDAGALTATQVTALQTETYNEINGWLTGAGFSAPVTSAGAILTMAAYENWGVAMRCELVGRTSGFRTESSETKAGALRTLYEALKKDLATKGSSVARALVGYGESRSSTEPMGKLYAGGISQDEVDDYEDDDDRVKPAFYVGVTQHPRAVRGESTLFDPDDA